MFLLFHVPASTIAGPKTKTSCGWDSIEFDELPSKFRWGEPLLLQEIKLLSEEYD